MKAIPTKYDGMQFRSRLEAKWACLFDSLGWTWEYEPYDLKGYIPDFVLTNFLLPILIEVKPLATFNENGWWREATKEPKRKIIDSGWKDDAILVGASVSYDPLKHPLVGEISWLGTNDVLHEENYDPFDEWYPSTIVRCIHCGGLSPYNTRSSKHTRCCDRWDDKEQNSYSYFDFLPLWRAAGNEVQWRAAR